MASYLKKVAGMHIDSFNYVLNKGIETALLDIDHVHTGTDHNVEISISEAKPKAVEYRISTRTHYKEVFPGEIRERKATYYAELRIQFRFESKTNVAYESRSFFIPLMLKSELCRLKDLDHEGLINHKEDPNDPGGYFIIDGTEKILRTFVKARRNYPLALIDQKYKEYGKGYSEYAVFTSCVKENHTMSDIYLHYVDSKYTDHPFIEVRLFYNENPYFIPLILLLKALVDESDVSIIKEISKFNDDPSLKLFLKNMFHDLHGFVYTDSKHDIPVSICNHLQAKNFIGELFHPVYKGAPNAPYCDVTDHLIKSSVFIHLDNNIEKFNLFCFCICKLFALARNQCNSDDLDNPCFQEVLLPGQIYILVLKNRVIRFLNSVKNSLKKKIEGKIENAKKAGEELTEKKIGASLPGMVKLSTSKAPSFAFDMKYFISTGNLPRNSGLMSSTGFTATLGRTNGFEVASQFNGIYKFSMCFYPKTMRKFYPESWGFLCPAHSPEGENMGLYNHLALGCEIPDYTEIVLITQNEHRNLFPGLYLFSTPCRFTRKVKNNQSMNDELIGSFEQLTVQIGLFEDYTADYSEISDVNFLGMAAAVIPFGENNPAQRNIFSTCKSNQALGFPFSNANFRSDNKSIFLTYPQLPIVATSEYAKYNWDESPTGINLSIAIISYSGYDMEDAIVLNKASVERGLFHDIVYKTVIYNLEELAKDLNCKVADLEFKRDPDCKELPFYLEKNGTPYIGQRIETDCPILSVSSGKTRKFLVKRYRNRRPAYIKDVKIMGVSPPLKEDNQTLPAEYPKIAITFSSKRIPVVGDKFSNRHSQKGICAAILPAEDMPFSSDDFVPDILFNPHGLPSRMTVGMLLEILASVAGVSTYQRHFTTQFEFSEKNTAADHYGDILKDAGLDYYGTQKFYSGTSGEQLEADVFCGFTYYFRLKHVVEEKYQVGSIAEDVDPKTMQPLNIDKAGALKFGEMERDAILSYGAMNLTLDRLLLNSDACKAFICEECQQIIFPTTQPPNLEVRRVQENKLCQMCQKTSTCGVRIPYVLVYLVSELATAKIKFQFSFE